jgi:hypothetical protein
MAMQWGKCTNYDQCDYARDNRVVEADTSNFKCPGCGRGLIPTQPPAALPGKRFLAWAGILLGALIVVGVSAWLMRANTPSAGQTGGGQTAATVAPTPTGAPPTITSPLQVQATAGQPFRYQITATNSPIQFAADNLPTFLALDSASGTLTGTPSTAGSFRISLHAVNALGAASAELLLTITPVSGGTAQPVEPARPRSGPTVDDTKKYMRGGN